MDRPRSPVKDAGLWVRSIPRLRCVRRWRNTKSRAAFPRWERRPRSLAPIRLSLAAHQAAPVNPAALRAAGPGLLPVHRLQPPAHDVGELIMIFVLAVDYLLDVDLVVVVAVVADVLPFGNWVADVGDGANDWRDNLCRSLAPDSCHPLRHSGDDAVARPNHPAPVSATDSHGMVMSLDGATGTGSRHPAQDALRPG